MPGRTNETGKISPRFPLAALYSFTWHHQQKLSYPNATYMYHGYCTEEIISFLVWYPVTVSSKRRTTTGFDMKQPLGKLEQEAHVYNFRQSKIASHYIVQRVTKISRTFWGFWNWEKPDKRRFRNGKIRVFKSDRKWINWDCQKLHLPKK